MLNIIDSACCPQCMQYALRTAYAGKDGYAPLTPREQEDWGRGHFLCKSLIELDLLEMAARGDIAPSLQNNVWRWVSIEGAAKTAPSIPEED